MSATNKQILATASMAPSSEVEHVGGVPLSAALTGAACAAAVSLLMLTLGNGLGLSALLPWARGGVKSAALGVSMIVWLSLIQLLATAMGGYFADWLFNERTWRASTESDACAQHRNPEMFAAQS